MSLSTLAEQSSAGPDDDDDDDDDYDDYEMYEITLFNLNSTVSSRSRSESGLIFDVDSTLHTYANKKNTKKNMERT